MCGTRARPDPDDAKLQQQHHRQVYTAEEAEARTSSGLLFGAFQQFFSSPERLGIRTWLMSERLGIRGFFYPLRVSGLGCGELGEWANGSVD